MELIAWAIMSKEESTKGQNSEKWESEKLIVSQVHNWSFADPSRDVELTFAIWFSFYEWLNIPNQNISNRMRHKI